jgi:hypothetical protein
VLRIRLIPVRGLSRNATLQVHCAIGKVPAEHQMEGIRMASEMGGVEYDEEISGRALFLLTRPGASTEAKAPTPESVWELVPLGRCLLGYIWQPSLDFRGGRFVGQSESGEILVSGRNTAITAERRLADRSVVRPLRK